MTTVEKMNLLKCPTWAEFQFDMNNGTNIEYDFKNCAGSPFTWWKNKEGQIIRSTTMYTPKVYTDYKKAYASMRMFFKKYGLSDNN